MARADRRSLHELSAQGVRRNQIGWFSVLSLSVNRSYPPQTMIITALIVFGVMLSAVAVVVLFLNVQRAPDGQEDETGFHIVNEPVVESTSRRAIRHVSTRRTKAASPLKIQIPAA